VSAKEFVQSFIAQPLLASTSNLAEIVRVIYERLAHQHTDSYTVTYSVDQFLFLSGFLVTYLFLKTAETHAVGLKTWFLFYFHRIWRLTPPYMLGMHLCVCYSTRSLASALTRDSM